MSVPEVRSDGDVAPELGSVAPVADPSRAARRPSRPTIEDVARLAGVSRGTVSRALNGGRNVRPAVLESVNDAIAALGYTVNQAARNLARGRTGSVAFVISERQEHLFEDPNWGVFVKVFSRELRPLGRHLLVTTAQDRSEEQLLGDYLTAGHVDGVLLALPYDDEPLLARLVASQLPTVVLGRPLGWEAAFSWVMIDEEEAAFEIVAHLVRSGRRRTATVTGPLDTSSGQGRLAGYRRALGMGYDPALVAHGDWSMQSGRLGAEQLLERGAEFDALFVGSDHMAIGAMQALREAGRRVPADVAVAGFDDSVAALMADPPLTTVRNPFEETAVEAVRILDDLMAGRGSGRRHVVLPTELVVRAST